MEMALQMPSNYVEVTEDEMMYVDGGGFVGFVVHLSSKVRDMGAIAGGAFVGGVVGWYSKELAASGPWGAGAAATITATAAGVAGYAIKKGLKTVNIGVDIPFVSYKKHLYI